MTATAASCLGFSFLLLRVHKHNCNSHVQTRNSAGASYHRIKLSAPPLSSKQQKGKRNSPKIWCEISRLCSHGVKSNVSELCTDKFYPGLSVVHMCSAEWDVICLLFWRNFSHKTAYLVQMYNVSRFQRSSTVSHFWNCNRFVLHNVRANSYFSFDPFFPSFFSDDDQDDGGGIWGT